MPMIDVYAPAGAFADKSQLARSLAAAVMVVEKVPDIPMFRENTAVFIHELPHDAISNVDGGADYVRVQVLTNAGALDRDSRSPSLSGSRPWSRAHRETHRRRRGYGCCLPRLPTAAGVYGVPRTPTTN